VIIGAGSCWLFLLLGWAGLLLSTTTLCLQKHKEHTCRTAQQQDVSTAKERGVDPCLYTCAVVFTGEALCLWVCHSIVVMVVL
jgi:hypothetical protein